MGIMLNPKIQEFGRGMWWMARYAPAEMLSCNLFPIRVKKYFCHGATNF